MSTWKDGANFSDVLVAADGEILATVHRSIGTGYIAEFGQTAKRYYTREQAKAAAEKMANTTTEPSNGKDLQ